MTTTVKQAHSPFVFAKLPAADLVSRGDATLKEIAGNPDYPDPPVVPPDFGQAIAAFTAAIADAGGRSKEVIAALQTQRKNRAKDMTAFLARRFQAASSNPATPQRLRPPDYLSGRSGKRRAPAGVERRPHEHR